MIRILVGLGVILFSMPTGCDHGSAASGTMLERQ
jgi:hypothetical protein